MSDAALRVRHGYSTNLNVVAGKIKELVDKGIRDGEARQLAVKIVSGSFDWVQDRRTGKDVQVVSGYGKLFLAPPGPICKARDERCEIERVWDFMVSNVRYVYDPKPVDTFCTLRQTLLAGGADCDDCTIAFATLLGCLGFSVMGRIISKNTSPNVWEHIYPMVGLTKDKPEQWVPLDMTVEGAVPGWEYDQIGQFRDYLLV